MCSAVHENRTRATPPSTPEYAIASALDVLGATMHAGTRGAAHPRGATQPGPQLALQVQRAAVARFWGILSEFCALGGTPEQWQHSAAEGPFISFSNQSQQWAVVRLADSA